MLSTNFFHLCQTKFGLSETYQELHRDPLFCVFCDALYLPKPEEGVKIAKEFEREIKKHLMIHRHHFDESTLKKTLDHAQKYFFKTYGSEAHLLKVAVLILIEPFNQEKGSQPFFYAAGLGDFQLFEVNKPFHQLFYDQETPHLPLDLSLKKRFQFLTNTLGQTVIKPSILQVPLKTQTPLLLMSYGTYSAFSKEKWLNLASDFENKKNHLIHSISKAKDKEHLKHLTYISFQDSQKPEEHLKYAFSKTEPSKIPLFAFKKSIHFFHWAFKIAIVFILGLCILELTNNAPSLPSFHSHSHEVLKNPLKEPHMQLNLRSLKKPVRFPFIKERAFLLDLKEKYDRQTLIIEKLNARIREQDKGLRDLQTKTYYPVSSYPLYNDAFESKQNNS